MKSQRKYYRFIGWPLAAALLALPAGLVHADTSAGPAISINRGETYVITGLSPGSRPEVKGIDNPNALIVNVQPDGSVLLLGADSGTEQVKVHLAAGGDETYTVTVHASTNPHNPLAGGGAAAPAMTDGGLTGVPAATPLDSGTGPTAPSTEKTANSGPLAGTPGVPVASGPAEILTPGEPTREMPPVSPAPAAVTATTRAGSPDSITNNFSLGQTMTARQAAAAPKFPTDPRGEALRESSNEPVAHSVDSLPDDAITMMFGTSKVFDFQRRIKRVSIADSEIADLQVITPHQLMLVGHKPGFTTLAVWDDQGNYEERQVRIEQTGHQQVLLNCTVAELNRSQIENAGMNWTAAIPHSGVSVVGLNGNVATPYTATSQIASSGSNGSTSGGILPNGGQLIPLLLSSSLTYGLAYDAGNFIGTAFFQYLEEHQLAKILAEPHLLANSGQEAKFLEGGEIPIVLAQALNTSIVFKQYGTSVIFIPTVVGRRDIELVVKPEVSEPDFAAGVQMFGFTVPAFVTRRAETVVRMKENQTLIIAGLILHNKTQTVDKVPYLGDIPYAGMLFKTTSWQDTKTELVMSVTPQIVGALPPGAVVDLPDKSLTAADIKTVPLDQPDVSRPRF
jgi:Flp pilus assembly secretin CpaC